MSPHGEEGDSKQMSQSRKHDILRGFIRNVVGPIFPDIYVVYMYIFLRNIHVHCTLYALTKWMFKQFGYTVERTEREREREGKTERYI